MVAKKATTTRRRRKEKKNVERGQAHIQSTFNNTIVTLTDLEGNFAARTRSLIEGGRTDFDIEMQVLRDRLAREGVRPQDPQPTALEDRRGVELSDLIRETLKAARKPD